MDAFYWLLIASFLLLALLFSTSNYALRTFNRYRLERRLADLGRRDQLASALKHLDSLILTAATLRMVFNILIILSLSKYLHDVHRPHGLHLVTVGLLSLGLMLVFSVGAPTAWSRYSGEVFLARMLPLLQWLRRVLTPVNVLLRGIDGVVRRLTGHQASREEHIEQDILSAVSAGEHEGVVAREEKAMIESVLHLQETRVQQVMTPRTEIVAIDAASDLDDWVDALRRAGHSRIPVYEGSLDNIIGILYVKDLLLHVTAEPRPPNIRQIMRQPLFVPELKSLNDLLADLRRQQVHIAVVLDEFGGTAGLVTIEDVLEEIVGDIADEHEQPEPALVKPISRTAFEVDGRARVDDLNRELGLDLPQSDDYDTISGLVIASLGHIPKSGEQVSAGRARIAVLAAEPRRIRRLRVEVAPAGGPGGL